VSRARESPQAAHQISNLRLCMADPKLIFETGLIALGLFLAFIAILAIRGAAFWAFMP
jgi:hypothetical protein